MISRVTPKKTIYLYFYQLHWSEQKQALDAINQFYTRQETKEPNHCSSWIERNTCLLDPKSSSEYKQTSFCSRQQNSNIIPFLHQAEISVNQKKFVYIHIRGLCLSQPNGNFSVRRQSFPRSSNNNQSVPRGSIDTSPTATIYSARFFLPLKMTCWTFAIATLCRITFTTPDDVLTLPSILLCYTRKAAPRKYRFRLP